eukprot:6665643-Heterocapsa_arctica.AAC.1
MRRRGRKASRGRGTAVRYQAAGRDANRSDEKLAMRDACWRAISHPGRRPTIAGFPQHLPDGD